MHNTSLHGTVVKKPRTTLASSALGTVTPQRMSVCHTSTPSTAVTTYSDAHTSWLKSYNHGKSKVPVVL